MDKPEISYYNVTPKVILSDQESVIRITPLFGHVEIKTEYQYRISWTPLESLGDNNPYPGTQTPDWKIENGCFVISHLFGGEQEHSLLIEKKENDKWITLGDFRVYSVREDLFALHPVKGDMHIHSNRSDGEESPDYVAAACRRDGFDFMTLTDHHVYQPSLDAHDAFKDIPIDLKIYPGEEVHPPGNPVHMLNVGGQTSINDMFEDDQYAVEVREIEASLPEVPESIRPMYASCLWCFDQIRKADGLGVFCHPYWISGYRYHIPVELTDLMFREKPFDAYEVIGGYHLYQVESNMIQVSRYHQESAKNGLLPIVGVSDAHGCDTGSLFGWYYTIVWSESLEMQDIHSGIRSGLAVAVEHLPESTARCHGPFRLSKFGQFLVREVFPEHDRLCRQEGVLMTDYLRGDPQAPQILGLYRGRVQKYMAACYGR